MKKVLFISSSRADYGLLRSVILETKNKRNAKISIMVTGSHLSKNFGKTIDEIKTDGLSKYIIKKKILKKRFLEKDISSYISQSILFTSEILNKIKPSVVVILGDRYELLGSAISAMTHRVPIAHIHGGETTLGAIDDSIRHSISKFSHLHFPIHEKYKKRLIQLGENPKTIFNYGGLGAYSISKTKFLSKFELEKDLKIKLDRNIFIITFHPTTLEKNKSNYQITNVLSSLEQFKNSIKIFTSPNIDHENKIILNKILRFTKMNKNSYFFKSLGHKKYISLMKLTNVVIGNSSSGVLETPSFGTPTVNIGTRQEGRILSKNIINSDFEVKSIVSKIKYCISLKNKNFKKSKSPFFKHKTPVMISNKILNFNYNIKKKFYDL
jgi:GDP/UDP-N,N'-diacetylbacillosamine 2-epimerase (hydrolysing)